MLLAYILFMAAATMYVPAAIMDKTTDYEILSLMNCSFGMIALFPARVCWLIGLIGGILLVCYQLLVLSAAHVEVPWVVRIFGQPLLITYVGSVLMLFLARPYYHPPRDQPGPPSE